MTREDPRSGIFKDKSTLQEHFEIFRTKPITAAGGVFTIQSTNIDDETFLQKSSRTPTMELFEKIVTDLSR